MGTNQTTAALQQRSDHPLITHPPDPPNHPPTLSNPPTQRAKEIKTHVVQNVGSVERHIGDYQAIIDNLNSEVQALRTKLATSAPSAAGAGGASSSSSAAAAGNGGGGGAAVAVPGGQLVPESSVASSVGGRAGEAAAAGAAGAPVGGDGGVETLAWLDSLATKINDNVEERINLQKALFELEDINVCNTYELKNIEEMLEAGAFGVGWWGAFAGQLGWVGEWVGGLLQSCHPTHHPAPPHHPTPPPKDTATAVEQAEALERRAVLQEEVLENEAEAARYRADIAANEAERRTVQTKIEAAIEGNTNANFLKILSTFRIQVRGGRGCCCFSAV